MTKESKSDEDNNDDNDDDLLSEINIGKIRSRYYKSFYAQLTWAWNSSCSKMLKFQHLLVF